MRTSPLLDLATRLEEITGVGAVNGRALIAELGTGSSQFPTPGHAAGWARLTPRSQQSGETAKPGRTGKGNRYLRGALGQAAMTAARTDTRLGAMYRRIARKRGKQKAIVAVSRVICETAWMLICDPSARYTELGPDYYRPLSAARQTQAKIRDIERLNPGKKVILAGAGTGPQPDHQAQRNYSITRHVTRCHATRSNLRQVIRNPRSHAAEGGWLPPSRWGSFRSGDPVAVLPVLFAMLWRGSAGRRPG